MSEQTGAPAPSAPQSLEQQVQGLAAENIAAAEKAATPATPVAEAVKAPEPVKKLKQLKYKANGAEHTEDLPFEIDDNPAAIEYLTKQFSLARAAQEAMQENSSTKKQVNQLIGALQGETADVLKELGIDPVKFAQTVIENEIKKQQMTPEQRELEELRAHKKAMAEESKRLKEEAEKESRTKEEQLQYEKISNEIADAIKTTYLPKQPETVRRVANYLRIANQAGIEMSAKEVMQFVEQDLKEELQSIIKQLGDDNVEDFVGKDVFAKVRKRNIAKAKATPTTPATAKSGTVEVKAQPKTDGKPEKKLSYKDFFGT